MSDSKPYIAPLSPPKSPRMSQYPEPLEASWQESSKPLEATPDSATGEMAMVHPALPQIDDMERPSLQSHKSYPYPMSMSGSNIHQPDTPPLNGSDDASNNNGCAVEGLGITIPENTSAEIATITFGGSAPASPLSNATPISPSKDDPFEHQHDLNGLDIQTDDGEMNEDRPMTAAEIRAQKRKMKRFRLTHNQTRFLMSEFARQAHPDAAHRERLAREIPGLSPRQVQVWFQNRRAKLKRLTSDDRERMMRSRALPDDFDMTQALHSPFGTPNGVGSPMGGPGSYQPHFPEGNMIRPLSLDTLRVRNGPHMSPAGMSPSFGGAGFGFTPPQSVTDTLSPVSAGGDSPFSTYSPTFENSPRRSNPFAPVTSAPHFTSHPQIPRLHMNESSLNRSRSESLASPLRSGMTYGGPDHPTGLNTPPLNNDSNGPGPGMGSYSLGYSYSSVPGLQATSNSRIRSYNNSYPGKVGISRNATSAPPQSNYSPYTSSPLHHPQTFPMMSGAGPTSHSFGGYMRQSSPGSTFPGVDSILGDDESNHNESHNNEGGLQSLTTF